MTRPIERILPLLQGVVEGADGWTCLCPAHEDTQRSMSVSQNAAGKVLIHCFAGCTPENVVSAVGLKMRDLSPRAAPVTLYELASHKRLPPEFLRSVFLLSEPAGGGVSIPYAGEDKRVVFARSRTALRAKDGTFQPRGVKLMPYCLWLLDKAREVGEVVLVEGESDCWTLWHNKIPAIGLPGAQATKALMADHMAGISSVLVWREPGAAGERFATDLEIRLLSVLKYGGKLRVLSSPQFKDPSDMHLAGDFPRRWAELLAAPHIPVEPPPPPPNPTKLPYPPGVLELTDRGNGERFVAIAASDLRSVPAWADWVHWDGRRWSDHAGKERALELAFQLSDHIRLEAPQVESREAKERLWAHAKRSESIGAAKAAREFAWCSQKLQARPADFDERPWLLNCVNGTVDLRTGELCPHRREDMLTKVCPTPYDPAAACPDWLQFLDQVFAGDADMIAYVRRLLGYCLSGDVSTHILPVFWGDGGNGKGTLINTFLAVMGQDYSGVINAEVLMVRRGEQHPTELADLYGKRAVSCQETSDGSRLNESLVKSLTGGDPIRARRMHENFWQFNPSHKLILATNYQPTVRGNDEGIWRRLRLVPFTQTFTGSREDKGLAGRLLAEKVGVLAWAVGGCAEWVREGERTPETVTLATTEYRDEQNTVGHFVAERCVRDVNSRSQAADLYAAYKDWCDRRSGGRPATQTAFGLGLAKLGFAKKKGSVIHYSGVRLRTEGSALAHHFDEAIFS